MAPALETTPIPGLLVVRLPVHEDARGWFKENWQRAKMTALGLPDFGPVQHSVAFNARRKEATYRRHLARLAAGETSGYVNPPRKRPKKPTRPAHHGPPSVAVRRRHARAGLPGRL